MKTAPASLRRHPNYSDADYAYLTEKGYNAAEIRAIWNRDRAHGHTEPQLHLVKPFDIVGYLSRNA